MNIKYSIKDNKYYTIYYILLNIIEYYILLNIINNK